MATPLVSDTGRVQMKLQEVKTAKGVWESACEFVDGFDEYVIDYESNMSACLIGRSISLLTRD